MASIPRRALLLMDNRLDRNWGSQATTSALVEALKDEYPGIEVQGVPRHWAGRPKWRRSLGYRWAPDGPLQDWRSPIARAGAAMLTHGWSRWIEWADLVIVNAEGTLHPQVQTLAWLPAIDWIRRQSVAPIWVVNATIDRFDGQEDLFRSVLSKVDRLVLRDPASFEFAKAQGWKAELGADAILLNNLEVGGESRLTDLPDKFVAATGAATAGNWQGETVANWLAEIESSIAPVVFLASTPTDEELVARTGFKGRVLTDREIGFREWLQVIARSSLLVGGRYHALVAAAMSGAPFVPMASNTGKIQGWLRHLESPSIVVDSDAAAVATAAREAFEIGRSQKTIERCRELRVLSWKNVRPAISPDDALLE